MQTTPYHRHKQRVLTTIVTLIALFVSLDTFIILNPGLGLDLALLYAFTVAIGIMTAYQCYNYKHSHEHTTLVNTLTQIFLGSVLVASCLVILLLHVLFSIDIVDAYLALSLVAIVLVFTFLKKFDAFLEFEIRARFPEQRRKVRT